MNSNYINNFEYKKHLDLLRFLAISLVYLFHTFSIFYTLANNK